MKPSLFRLLIPALLLLCLLAFVACDKGKDPQDTLPPTDPATEAVTDPVTEPDSTTGESESETTTDTLPEGTTEDPFTDVWEGEVLDAPYAADFTVSGTFSNDMVVQRGEYIRVWGWANESENGKKVSGSFKGMTAEAIIKDGAWEITFGARLDASAEPGHTLKIYTDTKTVEFTDVLVGDVYMVIGQSNVAYSVGNHMSYCNNDSQGGFGTLDLNAPIRLFYNSLSQTIGFPQRGTAEECEDVVYNEKWEKPTQGEIWPFTAIGFYFAYHMTELTDGQIPVGVIEIDGNGQPIGAFMSNEAAEATGSDIYNERLGYYTTTGINGNAARYMYNHYMNPFERTALAGVIWYQGESDLQNPNATDFPVKFTALMNHMRSTHNLVNRDFPVYIIEFPTIYTRPEGYTGDWHYLDVGYVRTMLGRVLRDLPGSYMTVSSDLWADDTFYNSLHPHCKYEQGVRTAELAAGVLGLAGRTIPEASGPVLTSIELSEDGKTAVLTYDHVGEGLRTSDGSGTVRGFLAMRRPYTYDHNLAKYLTAKITAPNQITITSSRAKIAGVAYNAVTTNFFGDEINLCNSYGIPAGATVITVPTE